MLAGGEKFEIIALLQNRTIVGGDRIMRRALKYLHKQVNHEYIVLCRSKQTVRWRAILAISGIH